MSVRHLHHQIVALLAALFRRRLQPEQTLKVQAEFLSSRFLSAKRRLTLFAGIHLGEMLLEERLATVKGQAAEDVALIEVTRSQIVHTALPIDIQRGQRRLTALLEKRDTAIIERFATLVEHGHIFARKPAILASQHEVQPCD